MLAPLSKALIDGERKTNNIQTVSAIAPTSDKKLEIGFSMSKKLFNFYKFACLSGIFHDPEWGLQGTENRIRNAL
jgi:hypothetical protein